ncbi:uncharacterized protein LOC142332422 [Lycorma delicatula]|uniref:uncharacterized protein LOC142332422 n=1 Tax=Lycorma delicatula TaxID=130591 RepID=UPI003F51287C
MYLIETTISLSRNCLDNTHNRSLWIGTIILMLIIQIALQGTVVPPPWADPNQNPCASQPGGWQLLYWPPDQKCYKIFQKGYPCPDSMELTPGLDRIAECRCPPSTAQSPRDALCHSLYQKGPCGDNEYFAPVPESNPTKGSQRQRWGVCLQIEKCANNEEVFWPNDGRCYTPYTRGPCPEGQLLSPMSNNLADCKCQRNSRLAKYYWESGGTCHEHYTAGPCQETGMLFLPNGKCGCHSGLQQFHPDTAMCYQLGTVGPCLPGHQFIVTPTRSNNTNSLDEPIYARCTCKEGHVRWTGDGICYRPYTRGPCQPGFMYSANKTEHGKNMAVGCIPVPCPPGRLYFPGRGCFRVGTQGPCLPGQVVLFQESVKTSVEGISYKGMCGCPSIVNNNHNNNDEPESFYPSYRATELTASGRCPVQGRKEDNNSLFIPELDDDICTRRGTILWSDDTCVPLYTQGPCNEGEWVVPDRGKGHRKGRGNGWKMGKCECRPGFTVITLPDSENGNSKTICQPPVVTIARFLNNNNNNLNNKNQNLDDVSGTAGLDKN